MRRKNVGLLVVGIAITSIYIYFLHILTSKNLHSLSELPLNAIGDFLAGAFGPIAIFWLILGFIQQGIELSQNTSALKLQVEELKNSVEQQRRMVQVTKEQIKVQIDTINYERRMSGLSRQPILNVISASCQNNNPSVPYSEREYIVDFKNTGLTASNLHINSLEGIDLLTLPPPILESGGYLRLHFKSEKLSSGGQIILNINYNDNLGLNGQLDFMVDTYVEDNKLVVTCSLVEGKIET